jgi:pteridine reductase
MSSQGPRSVKERPRALVTGGAVRVGRAIALALARAGMDVAIGYHRSATAARQTRQDLEKLGARAVSLRADLASPIAACRLVRQAAATLGGLEVLVNSAALFGSTPFGAVTPTAYDRFLNLNLRGPFFCAQAAARIMGRRGGHIVNIGDVATRKAWPSYIPYTLSKAGIVALTRSLAVVLRPQRIAVNCVAPGAVLRPESFSRARWRAVTRGHEGSAEDVAAAVVFLATCPPYITGQVLGVDGGESA